MSLNISRKVDDDLNSVLYLLWAESKATRAITGTVQCGYY